MNGGIGDAEASAVSRKCSASTLKTMRFCWFICARVPRAATCCAAGGQVLPPGAAEGVVEVRPIVEQIVSLQMTVPLVQGTL